MGFICTPRAHDEEKDEERCSGCAVICPGLHARQFVSGSLEHDALRPAAAPSCSASPGISARRDR